MGDSRESGVSERSGVVGQMGGAETGEDTEGEVEAADEDSCGKASAPVGIRKSEISQRALGASDGVMRVMRVSRSGWERQSRKKWVTIES